MGNNSDSKERIELKEKKKKKNDDYFTKSVLMYYDKMKEFEHYDLKTKKTSIFIDDKDIEELGSFNHGVIFKGYNKPTKEHILIKKLKIKKIEILRLEEEIKFFEGKKVPNILNLLNHSKDATFISLFFEYPTMVSLEFYKIKLNNQISIEKIKFFTYKILRALEYLHSNNLVHGDLNLENIYIYKDGQLKLDFGTKKFFKNDLKIKMNKEVGYQSIQAIETNILTRKDDIWSLGCIVYELMQGRQLFLKNDFQETVESIRNFDFSELKFINNSNSFAIDFINCCLKKNAIKRKNVFELLNHEFIEDIFLLKSKNTLKTETNNYYSDFNSFEKNTMDLDLERFKNNYELGLKGDLSLAPKLRDISQERSLYDDIINSELSRDGFSFKDVLEIDKKNLEIRNKKLKRMF